MPRRYKAYEEALGWEFRQAVGSDQFAEPVFVRARFYRSSARRCDGDNLFKAVLDAGNGVGWVDDSQVVRAEYRVDRDPRRPRAVVQVSTDDGGW